MTPARAVGDQQRRSDDFAAVGTRAAPT